MTDDTSAAGATSLAGGDADATPAPVLRRTPLYEVHLAEGARMAPFAGWEMPLHYSLGILGEHLHTRARAGLFDVSHMGQIVLRDPAGGGAAPVLAALETLIPANLVGLAAGRQRYGLLTGDDGGILDDLMVANKGDHVLLVVNAATTEADLALLAELPGVAVEPVSDRALIALQGPQAEMVLGRLVPATAAMRFMDAADHDWDGATLWITRSGYTGEDGFEISLPADRAAALAETVLAMPEMLPIGLGARDSLRLEAGMPLCGQDMHAGISPAEAGLGWAIPASRRAGGPRAGGFPGAVGILAELAEGPTRVRRGLAPEGRAPIRSGTEIYAAETGGRALARVTSGGFGPSVGGPIAMAAIDPALPVGALLWADLRSKRIPVRVRDLPFIEPRYKR